MQCNNNNLCKPCCDIEYEYMTESMLEKYAEMLENHHEHNAWIYQYWSKHHHGCSGNCSGDCNNVTYGGIPYDNEVPYDYNSNGIPDYWEYQAKPIDMSWWLWFQWNQMGLWYMYSQNNYNLPMPDYSF